MVKDRLKALQIKADISCAEWSKLSTVPEATIRKILSGETPDPRFDTIAKLVTPLGGSLDDIIGVQKEVEIENNAVLVLKEAYESRIEALRERVDDIKKYAESLHHDKKMLGLAVVVLAAILVGILIFDIALDTNGWIRR
jgi:predicted transcriptional regulator